MTPNIGIDIEKHTHICEFLHKFLANTYSLYLKTQHAHWNLKGATFYSLHLLFQTQYEEMAEAIDEIAERMKALGAVPEGSFSNFSNLSILKEIKGEHTTHDILQILLEDHQTITRFIRDNLSFVESAHDGATADMMNKRMFVHEKASWMLRSSL